LGLQLGARGDSNSLNGSIADAFIWNRALLPGEVMQHTMAPYAMIQPPTATKFYSYAAVIASGNRRRRILCAGSIA